MRRVLARVPGYGGESVCEVIGEDEKYYILRVVFKNMLKYPLDYVDGQYPPENAPRVDKEYVFRRKKKRCVLISESKGGGNKDEL